MRSRLVIWALLFCGVSSWCQNRSTEADSIFSLVQIIKSNGNFPYATQKQKEGLDIALQAVGGSHVQVAEARVALADLYLYKGSFNEAENELNQAETVYREKGLEQTAVFADMLACRAALHINRMKIDAGLSDAEEALRIYEQEKADDIKLIDVCYILVMGSFQEGKMDIARKYIHHLAALLNNIPSKDIFVHQERILVCAQYLMFLQHNEEALDLLNHSHDLLMQQHVQSTNPFVLSLLSMRAAVLVGLNRLEEAEEDVLKMIASCENSFFFDPTALDESYLLLADIYKRKNEYIHVLEVAQKAYTLASRRRDDRRKVKASAKSYMAEANLLLENRKAAMADIQEELRLLDQLGEISTPFRAGALSLKAGIEQEEDPIQAIEDAKQCEEILLKQDPVPYDRLATIRSILYSLYLRQTMEEEAKTVLADLEKMTTDTLIPVALRDNISISYYGILATKYTDTNPKEAILYIQKAKQLAMKYPGYDMSGMDIGLARCYAMAKEFELARQTIDTVLIELNNNERKRLQYVQALQIASYVYASFGDVSTMKRYQTQSVDLMKEIYGSETVTYCNALVNNAYQLSQYGLASEAYPLCKEAERKLLARFNETEPQMLMLFTTLQRIESAIGNIDNAILYGKKAKVIADKYHLVSAQCELLIDLSLCYQAKSQFNEALRLLKEADRIAVEAMGHFAPVRINIFYSMANVSQTMGNYSEASSYYDVWYDMMKRVGDTTNPQYAYALMYEATEAWKRGEFDQAEERMEECVQLLSQTLGENNIITLEAQTEKAMLIMQQGNMAKGIEELERLWIVQRSNSGYENPNMMRMLASAYGNNKQFKEQLTMAKKLLDTQIRKFGKESQQAGESYLFMANAYAGMNNVRKSAECSQKAFTICRNMVLGNFLLMSKNERANLWNSVANFFTFALPTMCANLEKHDEFTAITYNAALLSKGLLLQTETTITDLIYSSTNENLKQEYAQFVETRKLYQNATAAYPKDGLVEERLIQKGIIDSLENELDKQEHTLMAHVNEQFGDYTSNLAIVWTDVQRVLKQNEIAIEFVQAMLTTDSLRYIALVLTPDCKVPVYIDLCAKGETDHIWEPVLARFPHVENIYFSPCEELYNLPIESYKSLADDTYLSDRYHFYRLSSTRELVMNYQRTDSTAMSLYGDVAYDASRKQMKETQSTIHFEKPSGTRSGDYVFETNHNTRGADIALKKLPGTANEVNTIAALADSVKEKTITAHPHIGTDASETSVKALSGAEERILHIATHGFYYPAEKTYGNAFLQSMLSLEYKDGVRTYDSEEDAALLRCGLFMAGAENRLNGDTITDMDDGILTAREIAMLNLKGLDMAVLSACETGLGDVTGDGVFGLQRGFKKAGTHSILMSLWKVDDDATCMLMTEFYRQWLGKGKSKHNALELAKKAVRDHKEKGWDDPQYWAAFILLDGLE